MKRKIFIFFELTVAFILALVMAEIIFAKIVGYPTYGVLKKVKITDHNITNIRAPYSKYWIVEGGNRIFKRNNLGLPGIDVNLNNRSKLIFILGNSYVEAFQVKPELMATSILQKKLQSEDTAYQVLNFGFTGCDVYDLYFQACYQEKQYQPNSVILVFTGNDMYNHKIPLNFQLDTRFGLGINSSFEEKLMHIINKSSYFNLLVELVKKSNQEIELLEEKADEKKNISPAIKNIDLILQCLKAFKKRYGTKFIFISIFDDRQINDALDRLCKGNSINFFKRAIRVPQFMIKKNGHLNEEGNKRLGDFLYEILSKQNAQVVY